MTDILSIGEILIDLTQTGTRQGIPQFSAYPGGAPANVAVSAARLGAKSAFVGKVGPDPFGAFLHQTLVDNHVNTDALYRDASAPTTLAVVSVDDRGERSFAFYRDRSADTRLSEREALQPLCAPPTILHFGSVSLTDEPARSATLAAVRRAKELGSLISYDPNYRPALWPDCKTALREMLAPLPLADILKVSAEELLLLAGTDDLDAGSLLLSKYGITLILITLGEHGVFYRMGDHTGLLPGVPTKVADTNGAGDTFLGAVLSKLTSRPESPLNALPREALEEILSFANRAASITCSRPGAIPAMPWADEV